MKRLAVLLLLLIGFSCKESVVEKPKKLLSENEMENILYDLSLLQALNSVYPKQLDDNDVDPRTYIYKKYKIDSLTFVQNHKYYAADLEKYQAMQKKISERLKAQQKALEPKGKTAPAGKPSKGAKPVSR